MLKRITWQSTEGRLRLNSSKELKSSIKNSALEEMNSANNHVSEVEVDLYPAKTSDETKLWLTR